MTLTHNIPQRTANPLPGRVCSVRPFPNGRTTAHLSDLTNDDSAPVSGSVAVQRSQYLFMGLELDYAGGNQTYGLREKRRVKPTSSYERRYL